VSIDPHQFPSLGSFIAYLEGLKGRREPPREYSMCSAPGDPYVAITIKEEFFEQGKTQYPPLISGFLVHQVRAGDKMTVKGFAGGYVLPEDVETRTGHILHLCAGSGIVPDYSIIRDSLERHTKLRHTLVYSNKTWDDIIFRDALTELEAKHPDRLHVIHTLTRQAAPVPAGPDVRSGRVSVQMLADVLSAEPESLLYACGPAVSVWERRAAAAAGTTATPRFMESMRAHLEELQVPRPRIKMEAYG
jgi:ferredoxin-NADP reductase